MLPPKAEPSLSRPQDWDRVTTYIASDYLPAAVSPVHVPSAFRFALRADGRKVSAAAAWRAVAFPAVRCWNMGACASSVAPAQLLSRNCSLTR